MTPKKDAVKEIGHGKISSCRGPLFPYLPFSAFQAASVKLWVESIKVFAVKLVGNYAQRFAEIIGLSE